MKVDLHIHSNCSDGSDTVKVLADKIKQSGIDIFALTDHDTVEGCKEMSGMRGFIPGVELTCICGAIKCHILGYGIDIENPELTDLIEKGKAFRRQKLEARIKYLKDMWDFEFTPNELEWLYSRKSVVKTHLANILVKRGMAENNIAAMKKYLDGCKTGNTRFEGKEAIQIIRNAGGIAVWAHPLGGEGEKHMSKAEFLPKLELMISFGIQGLECHYSRYNKDEMGFLAECAEKNTLVTSGGSDYHGSNKDIPLGKLNVDNEFVKSQDLTILERLFYNI